MIRVRPFRRGDAPAFRMLLRACLSHYGFTPAGPAGEARLLRQIEIGRALACDLALRNGRAAGFATWAGLPERSGRVVFLRELFVLPEARGRGAGRALVVALAAHAEARGASALVWQVEAGNEAAQAFSAALGVPPGSDGDVRVPATRLRAFRAALCQAPPERRRSVA